MTKKNDESVEAVPDKEDKVGEDAKEIAKEIAKEVAIAALTTAVSIAVGSFFDVKHDNDRFPNFPKDI